ncbi:hypothetical protein GCM10023097_03540 [Streptomyces collinus]
MGHDHVKPAATPVRQRKIEASTGIAQGLCTDRQNPYDAPSAAGTLRGGWEAGRCRGAGRMVTERVWRGPALRGKPDGRAGGAPPLDCRRRHGLVARTATERASRRSVLRQAAGPVGRPVMERA